MMLAAITIDLDPSIHLGPITLAWHGLTIAIGILVAGYGPGARYVRERGLDPDRMLTVALVAGLAGIVGARVFWLIEQGALLQPSQWLGSNGFSFYGALILSPIAIVVYLRATGSSLRYLDAGALAFPLGMAIGRVGDLINGEHYGPPTDAPWGVRHPNPEALVPDPNVAYHDGGLYEIVLALALFALVWPLRHRFRRPLTATLSVIGLYSLGRFFMFFYRSDSDALALGLANSQWTSLVLVLAAVAGLVLVVRLGPGTGDDDKPAPQSRRRSPVG